LHGDRKAQKEDSQLNDNIFLEHVALSFYFENPDKAPNQSSALGQNLRRSITGAAIVYLIWR